MLTVDCVYTLEWNFGPFRRTSKGILASPQVPTMAYLCGTSMLICFIPITPVAMSIRASSFSRTKNGVASPTKRVCHVARRESIA